MTRPTMTFLAAPLLLTAVACESSAGETSDTTGATPGEELAFHGEVESLLQRSCQGCHHDGGLAPFSLTDPETAAQWSEQIKQAVAERTMPPYLANASGVCGEFDDPNWLSDEEIDLLAQWSDAGAPIGDPKLAPPPREFNDHLDKVSATLAMASEYTPVGDGTDDYRCFLIDPGLDSDKFLTGFDIEAGVASQVHHVIVYLPDSDSAAARAQMLDEADSDYGYQCFGAAGNGVSASLGAAWAPGSNVNHMPEGTGVRMTANRPAIVQIHYNLNGGDAPDLSKVHLRLEDNVDTEIHPFFLAHTSIQLEPGNAQEVESAEFNLGQYLAAVGKPQLATGDVDIYGVSPHMHKRGRQQQLQRISGDSEDCMLQVERWDFNWQFAYYYETPLRMSPSDTLRMRCAYDTSAEDSSLFWGDGTGDEMCLMVLYAAAAG